MRVSVQRLALGAVLLALIGATLLIADRTPRPPSPATPLASPRVALIQQAGLPLFDQGVQGIVEGLAEAGFVEGKTLTLSRFNADNDPVAAARIAQEVMKDRYDLVVTAGPLPLQAMAAANRAGTVKQVFGLVPDTAGAGVGISPEDPREHPRHLTGYVTAPPIEEAFRLAKLLYPGLSSVGVVRNPAEAGSEAAAALTRAAAGTLGLKLVEAQADGPSAVSRAASELVAKQVQALWVDGDVTVLLALDAVVEAAKRGRIPVLTSSPSSAERGALFGVGPNAREVGKEIGLLAAQVLQGTDPVTLPVRNVAPERTAINLLALADLRDPWQVPEEALRAAHEVIDEKGLRRGGAIVLRPPPGRIFRVGLLYFGADPAVDTGIRGLFDGLRELGFVEGENLDVRRTHAQGDIANIPEILRSYVHEDLDLIISLTTPCLTEVTKLVKKTPVVFAVVYDPVAAGVGTSRTDHLPNITGVSSFPPVEETVELIRALVPQAKTVGTLYNGAEANSRKVVGVARDLFKQRGITLQEAAIARPTEVFQAAQLLATRNIDAFWITRDNTAFQSYDAIVKVADETRIPLIINDAEYIGQGGLACAGLGFYKSGYAAATLAARVLMGEHPANLPIEEVTDHRFCLNFESAQQLGVTFPVDLIARASVFVHLSAWYGRSARVALVQRPGEASDARREGLLKGLADAGLAQDSDFVLRQHLVGPSAAAGPSPLAALREAEPDLVIADDESLARAARAALPGRPVIAIAKDGVSAADRAGEVAFGARVAIEAARTLAMRARSL